MDLQAVLRDIVLPWLFPLAMLSGVLVLGMPRVGKTQGMIMVAMAQGRYFLRKQLDGFKDKPGELQVASFLDDPKLRRLPIEDARNFLESGETGFTNVKHSVAKFVKNVLRGIMDNEAELQDEPKPSDDTVDSDMCK